LVLKADGVDVYDGNYSDYLYFVKATREATTTSARSSGATAKPHPNSAKPSTVEQAQRRRKFPYRKVEAIEADIATTEARIAELHTLLVDPQVLRDGNRVRQASQELESAQAQLTQLMEHWEEAAELN
ncbi:MAG: hypothetical protein JNG89_13090, partial [Planctomycetaceae bacterium]|nr:hypothetical protein [Planctomycetaceae bacterium]